MSMPKLAHKLLKPHDFNNGEANGSQHTKMRIIAHYVVRTCYYRTINKFVVIGVLLNHAKSVTRVYPHSQRKFQYRLYYHLGKFGRHQSLFVSCHSRN